MPSSAAVMTVGAKLVTPTSRKGAGEVEDVVGRDVLRVDVVAP